MLNKINFLFGTAVAIVVLIGLATGQGPPIYSNFLQQQQGYGPPPMRPDVFMQRGEYESKKLDKDEYEKPDKEGKKFEKELKKAAKVDKKEDKEEDYDKYDGKSSTEAPSVLSSFSNSMSGAWSKYEMSAESISSLGRHARSVQVDDSEDETIISQ